MMGNENNLQPLSPHQLRRVCHPQHFQFETTAELEPTASIIGQPRGTRAIEFGISINSPGYNIFVLGDAGTGRTTAIRRFLEDRAAGQPRPNDLVYVHNFTTPHRPRAIAFPAGRGSAFKGEIAHLLDCLKEDLPKAFDSEAYEGAAEAVAGDVGRQQDALLDTIREKAAELGFALVSGASGLLIAPVDDGRVIPPDEFETWPAEEREKKRAEHAGLAEELNEALFKIREMDEKLRQEIRDLNREVGAAAIEHHFAHWRDLYQNSEDVLLYLEEMRADVLDNLGDFAPASDEEKAGPDLGRYEVNLLVDNGQTSGAPVIVEPNPTYHNLTGRIEYEIRQGMMSTNFTNLKAGSLHRANGGYLVMNARDVLRDGQAWMALKRAIRGSEVRLHAPEASQSAQALAKTLDPQPVPLKIKVVLLGSAGLYYTLYEQEEDFGELFKVRAEFDSDMPRDEEHELEYARFIASRCHEEGLPHFDLRAVEKVVEYGSRLCEDQRKLSTRFGEIADLVREASYWAGRREHTVVTADDVSLARGESRQRASLLEEHIREQVADGTVFIDTEGAVMGQVNGLTILEIGDYSFGSPSRITARTYMGEAGVVNIEREVELAGPIHNKGLMILTGYLGGKYAKQQPLTLSASLTFEQNYSGIDGDSASLSELCALLSSLSGMPLKQGIAVTGSINQRGQVQAIGGVTEKVEGFYYACLDRGLNGQQGVIIPAANVRNLMVREEIVSAAAVGTFHIWAIDNVDEAIALLTGVSAGERNEKGAFPKGTVHWAVQKRLLKMARDLKTFGDKGK